VALLTSPPGSLIVSRRLPRVEVRPEYDFTFGPEAVELMRRAGQVLDPWQADGMDLMLAVRAGKWACFEYCEVCSRQNGKGALLECRALAGLFLLGEELIMWSAHEYKTAMEAFRRMLRLLGRLGHRVSDTLFDIDGVPLKVNNTNGEEGLERLDTGQRLRFLARSKGSGRGFSGDVNLIDETFAYTPEQRDALTPTMNARPNPQIVYTSSPPLDSFSGLPMFELRARAEAILAGEVDQDDVDELDVDDSLGYRDWGAAGDLDQLDRINLADRELWLATNPAMPTRITPKTIARNRRMLGVRGFAREVIGIWPPKPTEGGGAIDPKNWAACADPESKREGDVALAADISPMRDYASIIVYGVREDGLGHGQLIDYRPGTHWIVERLVELIAALDPLAIGMGRGTYASLEPELTAAGITQPDDPDEPERGDLAVTNATDMAAATGQMLDATVQRTIRYIPAEPLDAAVAGAKVRAVGDTIAWARKGSDADTSPLAGFSVARWTYVTRAPHFAAGEFEPSVFFV
jgi:hypothetical protein